MGCVGFFLGYDRVADNIFRKRQVDMLDLKTLEGRITHNILAEIHETTVKFAITDPLVLSHFLAQTAHESAGFTRTVENLNYSAIRLLQVFPRYFNGVNVEEYAGNPAAIASLVYADRIGNGPEESLDGWTYRGRGYLQLTGRANYEAFDQVVNDDVVTGPDLVATRYPMISAGWFWNSKGLSGLASQGSGPGVVEAVTRIINGGTNGLEDRVRRFEYFYGILRYGAVSN